ncbi:MAG TPA: OmpH family outer membrane protein [Polyangiaceae bacterium]|jgi:outer membrane protein
MIAKFLGTMTLVFCAALPLVARAEAKIAVVDTQRAVMETEDGLRAQATLKKLFDNRQRELDKKQADLQKQRDDIEKQKDVLSKEAFAKKAEQWQKDITELQTRFVEYNRELQKKQGELTQPIIQKAMGLIRRLATQEGFDLVVDKQAAPYVRSDLDLTDRVITMYNQGAPAEAGKGSKPAPSKAPAKSK